MCGDAVHIFALSDNIWFTKYSQYFKLNDTAAHLRGQDVWISFMRPIDAYMRQ